MRYEEELLSGEERKITVKGRSTRIFDDGDVNNDTLPFLKSGNMTSVIEEYGRARNLYKWFFTYWFSRT